MRRWAPPVVALAVAVAIYAWHRPSSVVAFAPLGWPSHPLPSLVANLPDALWAFACAATIAAIWPEGGRTRVAWLAAGLVLVLAVEVGQGLGLLRGTFDSLDLVAIAAGYLAGCLLGAKARNRGPFPVDMEA